MREKGARKKNKTATASISALVFVSPADFRYRERKIRWNKSTRWNTNQNPARTKEEHLTIHTCSHAYDTSITTSEGNLRLPGMNTTFRSSVCSISA